MGMRRSLRALNRWVRWGKRSQAEPLSVWEALGEEYWRGANPPRDPDRSGDPEYHDALAIYQRKRELWHEAGDPPNGPAMAEYQAAELAFRKVVIARLHQGGRTALCFSGGGIRSATFGLGVLQGLAAHSWSPEDAGDPPLLLGEVDYLSTVSGGGFLGGWFSSWASRHPGGSAGVIRDLAAAPDADWEPEPEPLRYLRRFASYLNPQLGAFSADTWTLVATVLRNIVLNWLVLLPLLAAVLTLPMLLFALVEVYPWVGNDSLLYSAGALLAVSVAYMVTDLPSVGDARQSQPRFLAVGLAPLVLASILFTLYWAWQGDPAAEPGPDSFVEFGVGIMAVGVALGMPFAYWRRRVFHAAWVVKGLGFALVTGAVGGLLGYWATRHYETGNGNLHEDRMYAWLAVPTVLGIFALAQGVLVAMSSTITEDEDREWWARSMGWIFIAMVFTFAFGGIVLMTPDLAVRLPSIQWQGAATAAAGLAASALGLSPGTAGTKEGKDKDAGPASLSQQAMELGGRLAMPIFLLLLAVFVAAVLAWGDAQLEAKLAHAAFWSLFKSKYAIPIPAYVVLELALLAIPPLILARVIDANKFSLHNMYRSRLIRTFLGASNLGRKPNPFTGFDPSDNVAMTCLPAKPLHVINATLNLVRGENLAWQERKAESFTATRYHTGSCRLGYQRSEHYAGGLKLGGAITTSGAAANPNMGYNSSTLLSMIMMLFNARLGVWLANPGRPGAGHWYRTGPTYSIRPLIDEALGLTNDRNAWVNLSDGGHFENLGLYEMVLRRCRAIVVVDGSADPSFHFDDLGNAIRKIRIDLGIPIEFRNGIPITQEIQPDSRHIGLGKIVYSAVDGADVEDGDLIYIKASLNGNESRDVLNYADQNPLFPQQATSNQWFDESQFESYRRLGCHVIEEMLQFRGGTFTFDQFVAAAEEYCGGEKARAAGHA
jgi:hypothetical protein